MIEGTALLYEMRIYEPHDGKAAAMRSRFETHVAKLFAKHGIELMGAFSPEPADGRLVYVTRFADEAARKAAWASFGDDPHWKAVKAESEADGPLLRTQTVSVLTPNMTGLPLA